MSNIFDELKKLLFPQPQEQEIIILGTDDPTIQNQLNCLGLCHKTITLKKGPWKTFILKYNQQELALSETLFQQLHVKIISDD